MKTQHQRDGDRDFNETNVGNRNTEPIPLDLTIEILKRLPAESMFRFRNTDQLLCFSTPLLPQVSNDSSLVSKHEMLVLKNDSSLILRFYNSVRGIICISLGEICERRLFLICNPTTRQVLRIPNDITGFDPTYEYSYMYLGYDTRKGQYKILRIMMSEYGLVKHSVCTLEGDQIKSSSFSSWRHVECNISYRRHESHCNQVLCINGVVYYAALKRTSTGCNSFVIVSFDVGVEQLFIIESPKEIEKLDHLQLINYKGKLALFLVNKDNSYILCVRDDIKKQTWLTKTGLLSPSFCDSYWNLELMTCGGSTEAGEICFMSSLKRADALEIFFYDLKKNNFRSRVI